MNLHNPLQAPWNVIYRIGLNFRWLIPPKKTHSFGISRSTNHPKIEHIYVINLDRESNRWIEMQKELRHLIDYSGADLLDLTERYHAIDAKDISRYPLKNKYINPIYTLSDQLYVEPQPLALPSLFDLSSPIEMSLPEIAIAQSHINIWKKIATSNYEYVLILEDDVWFRYGFTKHIDQIWHEIESSGSKNNMFDILYLSYEEVKHGAPKTFKSQNVFCPDRGLWQLSGYVLSRLGAKKLLRLLPSNGPIDLWINQKFRDLDVLASKQSIICQRRNLSSTNSYSILPLLTKIGAINSESASLFHIHPKEIPVFAFGTEESGLSSLAMALSMLGYRCCSDLQELPATEQNKLLSGGNNLVFNAYVNIKFLEEKISILKKLYPKAKFFFTMHKTQILDSYGKKLLEGLYKTDLTILLSETANKWNVVCNHLRCAPPLCSFPYIPEIGLRQIMKKTIRTDTDKGLKCHKMDKSPWIVESFPSWQGIPLVSKEEYTPKNTNPIKFQDNFKIIDINRWFLREDTFTDNLALFRRSNIRHFNESGITLEVKKEPLGVREYSAAALTSQNQYLYGRFEATIKASNVPGIVTGFFLHRDSPKQEIDIEITGNKTDRLVINVYYNPGNAGAKFDYGYRGSAQYINLGFDASKAEHRFAIEWSPSEISWFVDTCLVYTRAEWNPTPIPNLPMALHINSWPSRSKEFTGRLNNKCLPSNTIVKLIDIKANQQRRLNTL